jgi:outer membrane immunogenic protein
MKKVVGFAAALFGGCLSAQAADLPRYGTPYTVAQPLNAYSWAGPYLGGTLGYDWGKVTNSGAKPDGFTGGIQGGYNWQQGQVVFGVEGDLQFSAAEDRFAAFKFSNPWFMGVRGRVGYAMNNVLLYGTGGLAFGELKASSFLGSESHTTAGWTAGVGAEVGFTPNWSAKVEYLYVDLGDTRFGLTALPHAYQFSTFRMGVNYRF